MGAERGVGRRRLAAASGRAAGRAGVHVGHLHRLAISLVNFSSPCFNGAPHLLPTLRAAGVLGENVKVVREKTKVVVTSEVAMSKRYLKYLTKVRGGWPGGGDAITAGQIMAQGGGLLVDPWLFE